MTVVPKGVTQMLSIPAWPIWLGFIVLGLSERTGVHFLCAYKTRYTSLA